jgi:hypothetical protein
MIKLIIYVGLGVWGLRSLFAQARPGREMNVAQSAIYWAALRWETDPQKLLAMAAVFDQEGFTPQASALRKRSALEQVSHEQHAARQAALRKALASTDPQAVKTLAAAFEGEGLGDSAQLLHAWARGLEGGRGVHFVPAPPVKRDASASGENTEGATESPPSPPQENIDVNTDRGAL